MSEERENVNLNSEDENSRNRIIVMRFDPSSISEITTSNERESNLRRQLLRELERLRSIMGGEETPYKKRFESLTDQQKEEFRHFFKEFAKCPICSAKNHESYLLKFFISTAPEKVKLKEMLINIARNLEDLNEKLYKSVNLGIPCCKCYSKLVK